ncbi:MAG: hypothetical protein V1928_02205 [Parcubacteria group bacterium]
MLFNIILICIVAVCVFLIVFIVARKLPKLKSLDVDTVPAAQIAKVRDRILLDRMKRRSEKGGELIARAAAPLFSAIKRAVQKLIFKIYALEKRYQREAKMKANLTGPELEDNVRSLLGDADRRMKAEEWREAEKILIEAVSLDPRSIPAYNGLAEIYSRLKEYKQSLQTRQFILKLVLKQSRGAEKQDENGDVRTVYPNAAEAAGLPARLREALRRSGAGKAGAYSDLGDVFRLMDKNDKALENFKQALRIEPNSPRHINKILETSIALKNKTLAREMLSQLEKANPENQKLKEFADKINEL